jgi:hypothetical protein
VGSGIPEWFNDKSTNSFGTIQLHSDLGSDEWWEWSGRGMLFLLFMNFMMSLTLLIQEREEKSRSMSGRGIQILQHLMALILIFPTLFVNFKPMELMLKEPLVLCAPGVPSVGPNGFWAYIPAMWFRRDWFGNYSEEYVGWMEIPWDFNYNRQPEC